MAKLIFKCLRDNSLTSFYLFFFCFRGSLLLYIIHLGDDATSCSSVAFMVSMYMLLDLLLLQVDRLVVNKNALALVRFGLSKLSDSRSK